MAVKYEMSGTDDEGQRIDNFLLRQLRGVPKTHVYRILRKGEVRVNGGRVKPTYRLQLDDRVRIPPVRQAAEVPIASAPELIADLEAAVLYEDTDFLVINKPAGVAVHGGSSIRSGVVEQLRLSRDNPRLALVHRLDRDTSGCLALAKNMPALRYAQRMFRERQVGKIYRALVWGKWPTRVRTVQAKLQRYQTRSGERRVRVDSNGQTARSDFTCLSSTEHVSELEIALHTGRTHQIRVHARHVGHPLIGDTKYGRGEQDMRLGLHASKLSLPLADGQLQKILAPLPSEWQALQAEAQRRSHQD